MSTNLKQRGYQYADRLVCRSSVTVMGDGNRVSAFRMGNTEHARVKADLSLDVTGGPALDFRLWPDTAQPAVVPLRLTPYAMRTPALLLGDWRLLPVEDDLVFQKFDPDTSTYENRFSVGQTTTSTGVDMNATALALGDWRIRPVGSNLVFEQRILDTNLYTPKMTIRT